MKPNGYREQEKQRGCWDCIHKLRIFMDDRLVLTCNRYPQTTTKFEPELVAELGFCPEHVKNQMIKS